MSVVTPADFIEFMKEKGARALCEICGNTQFSIPDVNEGNEVALPVRASGDTGGSVGQHIPALIAVCTRCGNVRLHAKAIVKPEQQP